MCFLLAGIVVAWVVVAGWVSPLDIATGLTSIALLAAGWFIITKRSHSDEDIEDAEEPPGSLLRESAVGLVLGLSLCTCVSLVSAGLRRTVVYDWFADRAGSDLVRQTADLTERKAWQSIAELLNNPLPQGISAEHKREIRQRHYDALLNIAAADREVRRGCETLHAAFRIAEENRLVLAGAAAGARVCTALLRSRVIPENSRIEVVGRFNDPGSKHSVIRVAATDLSGAPLAALGISDFLVSSDGRRLAVDSLQYISALPPPRHFVFVIAASAQTSTRTVAAIRNVGRFASSAITQSDQSEFINAECDAVHTNGTSYGPSAVTGGLGALKLPKRTCPDDGVRSAMTRVSRQNSGVIVLFTAASIADQSLVRTAAALRQANIPLHVVSFGAPSAADALSTEAVASTGGQWFNVHRVGLGDVREKLRNVVAGQPEYRITISEMLTAEPVVTFAPPVYEVRP